MAGRRRPALSRETARWSNGRRAGWPTAASSPGPPPNSSASSHRIPEATETGDRTAPLPAGRSIAHEHLVALRPQVVFGPFGLQRSWKLP